jgi:hypothetical protein
MHRTWICLLTLSAYLGIGVGVRGAHHHVGPQTDCALTQDVRVVVGPTSVEDDCDPADCPACRVLHLAQAAPAPAPIAVALVHVSERTVAAPAAIPHRIPAVRHSRAPPAA